MKNALMIMKLLSDETRLRTLMLLLRRELCVCQVMGVLGVSQPLVSRNLKLLSAAGLLKERRKGKLVFYSVDERMPVAYRRVIDLLKAMVKGDKILDKDLGSLRDCEEFQKKTGRCDMKTLSEFVRKRKKA